MFGRNKLKSSPLNDNQVIPGRSGPVQRFKTRPWHTITTISPEDAPIRLGLNLVVPSYGVIILQPPEDARIEAQIHGRDLEYDHVLGGTLEITLPLNVKRLRYKSIKIGFAIVATLDFGPGRQQEQDELFRREMAAGEGEDAIMEGSAKIGFSLVLPSWLPIQDYHKKSTVLSTLYAVIEGYPSETIDYTLNAVTSSDARSGAGSSNSSVHSRSVLGQVSSRLASLSLRSTGSDSNSSLGSAQPASRQSISTGPDGVALLTGRHLAERTIRMFHNPDPEGGANVLKEEFRGHIDGLGNYGMALYSDIWTISSLLKTTVAITDISPATTIFQVEVYIRQNHRVTSPRDDKVQDDTERVLVMSEGTRPNKDDHFPGRKLPALWRGIVAGGKDKDAYVMERTGRVPTDSFIRPTTQPGVLTPLHVSHQLEIDVRFSVHAEDAAGKRLHVIGPGELRVLRISRQTVMPSCTLMPDVLLLPLYENAEQSIRLGEKSHNLQTPWDACACFLTDAEVEERMRRAAKAEESEQEKRDEAMRQKGVDHLPNPVDAQ